MSAEELRDLALRVAREAADLVRGRRARGIEVADNKSSVTDPVTEADRASEELIRERLSAARPDDAFLGEEGDDVPGTSGVRWIIDPIDGTVNFLYGIPAYAVSIAAERHGEVVAGAVINVASGVEYAAALGAGATRDGEPIAVRRSVPLGETLLATGFGYRADARRLQSAAIARLLPEIRDLRRIGAAALDLCAVAEGSIDAYAEEGVNLWDHAAAGLIAREAGAVTFAAPGRWGGQSLVCGPAASFAELAAALQRVDFFGEGWAPVRA
jgi:myo-inositol-1(or 4)-monophosphatase